jgi:hypothetical protein
VHPAGRDDGSAGEEEREAAASSPEPHQGIAGQPQRLSRRRHVREDVASPRRAGERIEVS